MARRHSARQTAGRRRAAVGARATHSYGRSTYRRTLRFEPLEDRRLLAVVTVDTDQDIVDFNDGVLSLREAIFATNTVAGPDTIQFSPSLTAGGPATILLTQGELRITDDLTIDGPGAELLTINAQQLSRVFNIDNGDNSTLLDVSVSGLNLHGGAASSSGGTILSFENLALEDVVISDDSLLAGTGIFSQFGHLSVASSTISGKRSFTEGGAAIRVVGGDLTMTDSLVTGNVTGSTGAIISVNDGDAILTRVTVTDNSSSSATASGAGIATDNLVMSDCVVSGNQVSRAIDARGQEVQILNSTVSDNVWTGIELSSDVAANFTISHTTVNGNGGGIRVFNRGGGVTTIADSTISGNSTLTGGSGGITANIYGGLISITDCIVSENTGMPSVNIADAGGIGVRLASAAAATISDSFIFGNSILGVLGGPAGYGGGISIKGSGDSTATIADCSVYGNFAGAGGGISSRLTSTTISRVFISGNEARFQGGGIGGFSELGAVLNVEDSVVSDNSAGAGGGISALGLTSLAVSRSTISGNVADESIPPEGVFFSDKGRGGGIVGELMTIVDSTIDGNTATTNGGGIVSISQGNQIVGSTISNNSAESGGGVWMRGGTILQSTISGNSAEVSGGGIWTSDFDATVSHSTIADNSAGVSGGGLFVEDGTLTLDHSIVATNTAPAGRDLTGLIVATIEAHHSLIGSNAHSGLAAAPVGSPDANGNLIGGPSFPGIINPWLEPLADNGGPTMTHALMYGLISESPAIDAGDPDAMPGEEGVPVFDQRGMPFTRVYGGRIDIGAFESQPPGELLGDYNTDGTVDAADYVVWRDEMSVVEAGGTLDKLYADGNGDGAIDNWDYRLWRNNFGAVLDDVAVSSAVGAVAAPSSAVIEREAPQPAIAGAQGGQSPFSTDREQGMRTDTKMGTVPGHARQDQLLSAWVASRFGQNDRWDQDDAFARSRRQADDDAAEAHASAVDRVFGGVDWREALPAPLRVAAKRAD